MQRISSSSSLQRINSQNLFPRNPSAERLEELIELGESLSLNKDAAPVPKAEDVSAAHLDRYAVTLANRHRVSTVKQRGKPLLIERVEANGGILEQAYNLVTEAIMSGRRISSAEEWLADNYWLINEQLHMTRKHLPSGYSKEMPTLENTENVGFPRIYGLVLDLIALVNGQISGENIYQFVKSYQKVCALNIGEIWGIPIMLRLGLIENIRLVCDAVIASRKDRNTADLWADKLLDAADQSGKDVVQVLYTMSQSIPKVSHAFVLQILQRLQGSDPLLSVITTWLEQQLSTQGLDVDDINRAERYTNHLNLVRLRNSIISLRFVNSYSWKEFVEELSQLESILRNDPARIYEHQDFETRDMCRRALESLAKANKRDERDVAKAALRLAQRAHAEYTVLVQQFNASGGGNDSGNSDNAGNSGNHNAGNSDNHNGSDGKQLHRGLTREQWGTILDFALRKSFVGYYLLDPHGINVLKTTEKLNMSWSARIGKRLQGDANILFFLGSIASVTMLFVWVVLWLIATSSAHYSTLGFLMSHAVQSPISTLMLLVSLTLTGSQLAVGLVNAAIVHFMKPHMIPRMDFQNGVPDAYRTMVVVPTMITSMDGARDLVNDLRARFLNNRDRNIYYALLTDWSDAKTERTANDDILLNEVVKGIDELNRMYPNVDGAAPTFFYLFHRPRKYNAQEGVWMAWERKRGKLTQFTQALRGGTTSVFHKIVGDQSILSTIQLVITLDTDTMLPADAAQKLIGNAAHILNKPNSIASFSVADHFHRSSGLSRKLLPEGTPSSNNSGGNNSSGGNNNDTPRSPSSSISSPPSPSSLNSNNNLQPQESDQQQQQQQQQQTGASIQFDSEHLVNVYRKLVEQQDKGHVIRSGYGLLQPRVSVGLTGAHRSLYALINSLDSGLDPYTKFVSDVYQDAFGEGSFIGKGLYHVDAFLNIFSNLFPENRILSHDLIEGCYVRSGLVSDVELIEEYPSSYLTEASRRHRWVRGDWQIASWILPFIPSSSGQYVHNPLTPLAKWKIFDNLRRSLVPLSMVFVLLYSWLSSAGSLGYVSVPYYAIMSVLSVWGIPAILDLAQEIIMKQEDVDWKSHFSIVWQSLLRRAMMSTLDLLFLPFEAYNNVDAIVRCLIRLIVTKRYLLEWNTSTSAAKTYAKNQLMLMVRTLWVGPFVSLVTLLTMILFGYLYAVDRHHITRDPVLPEQLFSIWTWLLNNGLLLVALIGWSASPAVAWWLSSPTDEPKSTENMRELDERQLSFLRLLTRKTWRFFECFVRDEDNFLPLDNFQEFPKSLLARRTSPTNIAMALVNNITAWDFGYLSTTHAAQRIQKTLTTMGKMERYHGHFYNWYDTSDLRPLAPRYVSSVDSGNLIGYLVILSAAIEELGQSPILPVQMLHGLEDTCACLEELLLSTTPLSSSSSSPPDSPMESTALELEKLRPILEPVMSLLRQGPGDIHKWNSWFEQLQLKIGELVKASAQIAQELQDIAHQENQGIDDEIMMEHVEGSKETIFSYYAQSLEKQLAQWQQELNKYLSWAIVPIPSSSSSPSSPSSSTMDNEQEQTTIKCDSLKQFVEAWRKWSNNNCMAVNGTRIEVHQIDEHNKSRVTLKQVAEKIPDHLLPLIQQSKADIASDTTIVNGNEWLTFLNTVEQCLLSCQQHAQQQLSVMADLSKTCREMSDQDFSFLYNQSRNLISIGYNVDHKRLDNAYYDTFCSEARLCSYVMIAKRQLPVKHWFAMSRLLTAQAAQKPALLSWSGSMFEYLMPMLVMPSISGTLLHQTYESVVQRQIEYGKQKKVPWGISECAYNMMDAYLVYQYGPFGVPGLGLKRGLSNDLVVAPYASAMALMVSPLQACKNLEALSHMGLLGHYGMYESVDFTPHRLRGLMPFQPINSYFAHHQGMSLLGLVYTLRNKPWQRRFSMAPELHANELLLQEKIPRMPFILNPNEKEATRWSGANLTNAPSSNRRFQGLQMYAAPEIHLLSNGRLHVMVSAHGAGYINYKDLAVTRWREDVTCDSFGSCCYLRDLDATITTTTTYPAANKNNNSNDYQTAGSSNLTEQQTTGSIYATHPVWSTTSLPIVAPHNANYSVMFSQGKAEFKRNEHGIVSQTIVTVSPHDDVEVRRILLTNNNASSQEARRIELTSYSEIVLGSARTDAAHRAFSNLFIKTEILKEMNAILCYRQPRSKKDKTMFGFHILVIHDRHFVEGEASFETDRNKFIGRGYSYQLPHVMLDQVTSLSQSGTIQKTQEQNNSSEPIYPLDPIFAIRQVVRMKPGTIVHVDYITGVAESREEALKVIQKYQKNRFTNHVIDYSWISAQKLNFKLGITEIEAQLFGKLAGCLLYSNPRYRASPRLIAKNRSSQSSLWRLSISGDLPIILVRIGDVQNIELVAQILQAHAYMRANGLICDLVIWNDETSSYRDDLHSNLLSLIGSTGETAHMLQKPGGIFPVRGEHLNEQESILLYSVARVVLSDTGGRIVDQINRDVRKENPVPPFSPKSQSKQRLIAAQQAKQETQFIANIPSISAQQGNQHSIKYNPDLISPSPQIPASATSLSSFENPFEITTPTPQQHEQQEQQQQEQRQQQNSNNNKQTTSLSPAVPLSPSGGATVMSLEERDLLFNNGYGGFDKKRREYVIYVQKDVQPATPAPWCNILANEQFGTVVSEKGSSYSWFENAHEFRLTPWNNDSVIDSSGEAYYVRDEESGQYWSPMMQPCGGNSAYIVRHGMGYTAFEHVEDGVRTETTVFVPQTEPVKIVLVMIKNQSGRTRSLSVTGFVEWTLGELRDRTHQNIVTNTEVTPHTTAILARNPYHVDFTNHVAFFSIVEQKCTVTADRGEFIGYNRTIANPAAMERMHLSGTAGAALDPCAAIQTTPIVLENGKSMEVAFVLGAKNNNMAAKDLIERIRTTLIVRQLLKNVKANWTNMLSGITVDTPDPSVDIMVNGWLLYQVLSARIWGRTGFYQSSGAFGFRDQLQDSMSVVYSAPHILRQQIITCCEHQFERGDVLHWWHPQSNRGTRTTFSDDYLWLPLAVAHYIDTTGDYSLLHVDVRFATGIKEVPIGEETHFDQAKSSDVSASVYEHCRRSIKYGIKYGKHGIPLMGCGDWNDGMNLVGIQGKGESVWLAFFLIHVMERFEKSVVTGLTRSLPEHEEHLHVTGEQQEEEEHVEQQVDREEEEQHEKKNTAEHGDDNRKRNDESSQFVALMRQEREKMIQNLEKHCWDGNWYLRAFFDNGEPLGSHKNQECQIDSLPQSWAVLSGVARRDRTLRAVDAAYERLVKKEWKLIQLFDPAFDQALTSSTLDPGYIKGYAPGVRENGGQYTHAAIWMVWAHTILGNTQRAWELADLVNPINHGANRKDADMYKVEPYVVAADIYTLPGRQGQGGWSWYTGSSGWMYRLWVERFFGLRREHGNVLVIQPLPRPEWHEYKVKYRYEKSLYKITFTNIAHKSMPKISDDEVRDYVEQILLSRNTSATQQEQQEEKLAIAPISDSFTTTPLVIFLDGKLVKGHRVRLIKDNQTHIMQVYYELH